jgi:hypothetical protein
MVKDFIKKNHDEEINIPAFCVFYVWKYNCTGERNRFLGFL